MRTALTVLVVATAVLIGGTVVEASLVINTAEIPVGQPTDEFAVSALNLVGPSIYDPAIGDLQRDIARPEPEIDPPCVALPEPASIAIWSLIGLGGAGLHVWRRRKGGLELSVGPSERQPWAEEKRIAIRALIERGCRKS